MIFNLFLLLPRSPLSLALRERALHHKEARGPKCDLRVFLSHVYIVDQLTYTKILTP